MPNRIYNLWRRVTCRDPRSGYEELEEDVESGSSLYAVGILATPRFFNAKKTLSFAVPGSVVGAIFGGLSMLAIDIYAPWWAYAIAAGVGTVIGGAAAGAGPVCMQYRSNHIDP